MLNGVLAIWPTYHMEPQGTGFYEPNYANLSHKEYDWARTVYAVAREKKPHDLSKPLGKSVTCFYNKKVHKWVTTLLNNR